MSDIVLTTRECLLLERLAARIIDGRRAEKDLESIVESIRQRGGIPGVPYNLDLERGLMRVDTYTKEEVAELLKQKADKDALEKAGLHLHPHD